MGQFVLKAGANIELLTRDELASELTKVSNAFEALTREQEGETISRAAGSFKTDPSGNTAYMGPGGGVAYTVPAGFDAYLLRLTVDYEGSTAVTPQTCDVRIVADQNTPAGLRAIYNQVPAIFHASRSHAPLFRGGQRIVVCLIGGPVSTNIYPTVQVLLTRRKAVKTDTVDSQGALR
jgi:hypothetical protein